MSRLILNSLIPLRRIIPGFGGFDVASLVLLLLAEILATVVLGLVHGGTDTGYALVKLFETTPMGHYSASPGAIYPALKRLEARGLLKGQAQAANRGRPKRQFELTPEGHDTRRVGRRRRLM